MKYFISLLFLLANHSIPAQSIQVKVNRTITENNKTNTKLLVYFVDTTNNTINDSLDLYELNPYNHFQYEIRSNNCMNNNKTFQVNNYDDYDKLFPVDYRHRYFNEFNIEPVDFNVRLSSFIHLSAHRKSCNYLAIAYSLIAQQNNSDQIYGAISTIFILDSNKNVVYKKDNVVCVDNEIAVSDDGNFVAFRYGAAWSDGILINGGIQIIDTRNDKVVFQDIGYVEGPSNGYYRSIIRFSCNYATGYQRDYYFNTKTHKIFSLYYNRNESQDILMDVKPEGLLYRDMNSKEYFLFFENNFEVFQIGG